MAHDEGVAERIRKTLADRRGVKEKKMFGGLAFMLGGHLCCGVIGERLMARVGPERYALALKQPHAHPMDFTGKPLTGFVYVDPAGFESDERLRYWVTLCESFVASLPPK